MSYLLDTNVVSEWVKRDPAPTVVRWLSAVDEEGAFLSVVSLAELRRGVDLLEGGRRRQRLEKWLGEDLADRFHGRILAIDIPVADAWGRLTARASRAGRTLSTMDGFVAATAAAHGLTLVTRNVRDFERLGVEVLNPWRSA